MKSSDTPDCPLCAASAAAPIASFGPQIQIYLCPECRVEFAVYPPERSSDCDHFEGLDAEMYSRSVKATREASYGTLLAHVSAQVKGGRWLDVGCSYGWLLERVQAEGYDGYGVEPSGGAVAAARQKGLKVTAGIYPDVVGDGPPYSVISFIDVLEHLPEPRAVLEESRRHLAKDGVVAIQVPDQACLLHALAKNMCRWSGGRLDFAYRRLWLIGLDFPHRFYFNRFALERVLTGAGYEVVDWYRAPIGAPGQARDRVGYMKGQTHAALPLVAAGVAAINAFDNFTGHGGLLVVIARPKG